MRMHSIYFEPHFIGRTCFFLIITNYNQCLLSDQRCKLSTLIIIYVYQSSRLVGTLHARPSRRSRSCMICCLRLMRSIFLDKPLKKDHLTRGRIQNHLIDRPLDGDGATNRGTHALTHVMHVDSILLSSVVCMYVRTHTSRTSRPGMYVCMYAYIYTNTIVYYSVV